MTKSPKPPGLKVVRLFFILNGTEHEIYPDLKCENANNCWHFNIDKQDKYNIRDFNARNISSLHNFKCYEQLKCHTQLSGVLKKFYNLKADFGWLRVFKV